MEITLAQADLAYALQTALASVPSKSTLPILQGVLLETSDGHLLRGTAFLVRTDGTAHVLRGTGVLDGFALVGFAAER